MAVRADNEQPGAAWRLLDRRSTAAVAIPLIALGLLGWYVTVRQASAISGMVMGLGQVGIPWTKWTSLEYPESQDRDQKLNLPSDLSSGALSLRSHLSPLRPDRGA